MDKNRGASGTVFLFLLVLVLVLFINFLSVTNGNEAHDHNEEEQSEKTSVGVWHRLRNAYSIYSSVASLSSFRHWWHLAKALVNQTYTYFFPPNIDFRRGNEAEAVTGGENGAGEKVKEALAKSLGTSKATLEDAAKSAADLAGETIGKAKQKVKKSFSQDTESKLNKEL